MRIIFAIGLGVLFAFAVSSAAETVRAAIPDSRKGDLPLQLVPSPDLLDSGDSSGTWLSERVSGAAGDSVGWGVADEPARPLPTKSVLVSSRLTYEWDGGERAYVAFGKRLACCVGASAVDAGWAHQLSVAEVIALARRVTHDSAFSTWIGPVVQCESTGRPTAEGEALERGLTMIHPIHRPWLLELGEGYEWERQYEPVVNLRTAYALWERDDEEPWEGSRECWG